MKKQKLTLDELRVSSFVTDSSLESVETIKGGSEAGVVAISLIPAGCAVTVAATVGVTIGNAINERYGDEIADAVDWVADLFD